LTPEEQQRFRELSAAAEGDPDANLSRVERKELLRMWKRFEARKLIREVMRGPRAHHPGQATVTSGNADVG
jgi:hypothetical protein